MFSVVVLISGGGSNLNALLQSAKRDGAFRIVAVGADNEAPGLAFAREAGVATFVVEPQQFSDRQAWGAALLAEVVKHAPELVVSAGFMRILPANVVRTLTPNLINTHPALLPAFPGAHAVRDALAAGVSETGVTVHVIDEGVDTGPVIRQERVAVQADDTEQALHERIKTIERELLSEVVREIAEHTINLEEIARHGRS